MYGSDTTQAGGLAATGLALGVAGQIVAAAVIVLAGLALFVCARVVRHRMTRR